MSVIIQFIEQSSLNFKKEDLENFPALISWLGSDSTTPFKIISSEKEKYDIILYKHAIKCVYVIKEY